jgi:hypothetical protein
MTEGLQSRSNPVSVISGACGRKCTYHTRHATPPITAGSAEYVHGLCTELSWLRWLNGHIAVDLAAAATCCRKPCCLRVLLQGPVTAYLLRKLQGFIILVHCDLLHAKCCHSTDLQIHTQHNVQTFC